ncbi:DUF3710 domain-containing protein [Streptomyces sp. NPDC001286]
MDRIGESAKEIVEQYGRDGFLSSDSLRLAEFGVWDRLTPGVLLMAALCLLATEEPAFAERMAESGDLVLSRLITGDFRALELNADDATMSWQRAVAWLSEYARRPSATPDILDTLLTQAQELWSEALQSGEMTRSGVRDGESGPWDAAEIRVPSEVERLDCGVLGVPRLDGVGLHPLNAGGRTVGVIVDLGDHALSLQAFRVPLSPVWEKVRPKVVQDIRKQGGTAENAESGLGPEVRARVPVVKDGQHVLQPTRIFGCDGPGWLLRGVYGGPAALAEVVDPRAYYLFTQTSVDLSKVDGPVDMTQEIAELGIRWPDVEK